MTAPDDHLDLDAAAELDEGIDDDSRRRAHVATCEECNARLAQVRTTRALLSALPDETMPGDVADRLHAALPRESVLTTIVPRGNRRRRWTSSPALAGLIAAAAAIALVAAISIGSLRSSDHNNGADNAATAGAGAFAPRALPGNFPLLATGTHYTGANALSLVTAFDNAIHAAATPSASPARGKAQVAPKQAFSLDSVASVPASLRTLHDNPQALLNCVEALSAGPLLTPLGIDFAQFSGGKSKLHNAPAAVILLQRFDGKHDAAYIVGPRCDKAQQDIYDFEMVVGSG